METSYASEAQPSPLAIVRTHIALRRTMGRPIDSLPLPPDQFEALVLAAGDEMVVWGDDAFDCRAQYVSVDGVDAFAGSEGNWTDLGLCAKVAPKPAPRHPWAGFGAWARREAEKAGYVAAVVAIAYIAANLLVLWRVPAISEAIAVVLLCLVAHAVHLGFQAVCARQEGHPPLWQPRRRK